MYSMETKCTKTRHLGGALWFSCAFRYCQLYCVFSYSSSIKHDTEFQVKVEYVKDKWIAFMVSSCLVSAAEYRFKD